MQPKLSILIPTLQSRSFYLARLLNILNNQHYISEVELILEIDDGEKTIGEKRNILLNKATGKYITFIDDDDLVSSSYIEKIINAISSNPDVIGIHLLHFEDNILKGFTYHSLNIDHWYSEDEVTLPFKRYYRNPNHLNPVKREYAIQTLFPNISMGEDKDYSMRLLPLLSTEVYIKEPIYFYLFRNKK